MLVSGEQIISKVQDDETHYILEKPQKVVVDHSRFLTESSEDSEERTLEVTLSPWVLLSSEKEFFVPKEKIVVVTTPIQTVVEMYKDKINE